MTPEVIIYRDCEIETKSASLSDLSEQDFETNKDKIRSIVLYAIEKWIPLDEVDIIISR